MDANQALPSHEMRGQNCLRPTSTIDPFEFLCLADAGATISGHSPVLVRCSSIHLPGEELVAHRLPVE